MPAVLSGPEKEEAMDKEMQERIALFRFGLISSLVSHKGLSRGEQELRIVQYVIPSMSKYWYFLPCHLPL